MRQPSCDRCRTRAAPSRRAGDCRARRPGPRRPAQDGCVRLRAAHDVRGGLPQARGGLPQARGRPPQARGRPPRVRGRPPQARGGHVESWSRGGGGGDPARAGRGRGALQPVRCVRGASARAAPRRARAQLRAGYGRACSRAPIHRCAHDGRRTHACATRPAHAARGGRVGDARAGNAARRAGPARSRIRPPTARTKAARKPGGSGVGPRRTQRRGDPTRASIPVRTAAPSRSTARPAESAHYTFSRKCWVPKVGAERTARDASRT